MHLKFKRPIFFVLITLAISACDQGTDAGHSDKLKPINIRLGMAMQQTSALLIIAEEKGFFYDHGLNVIIKQYPSGKRALHDGLLNSEVDLVSLNESPFVLAAFTHHNLRALATIYIDDNSNAVIARRDHGIQLPIDLNGKILGTQKSSAVHYFLHQFIVENALDFEQTKRQFYKAEELVGELVRGDIDAFSMREPYISEAKKLLKEKAIVFKEPGIYTQLGLLVADKRYSKTNAAAIKRLLMALYDAEKFISRDREIALGIIADYIGIDKELFKESFGQAEAKLFIDQLFISISEDIARWAIKKELVNSKIIPNFLDMVTVSHLKSVTPDTVTLIVD